MATKQYSQFGCIKSIEYRGTSLAGNNYYNVDFLTESGILLPMQTRPNGSIGYGIKNFEYVRRVKITYHITEKTGKFIIDDCEKAIILQ